MSIPQTLLALTGRSHAPAKLGNATLVVIDAQEEYRSGVLQLPGLAPALEEIAKLLAAARAQGSAIVHVKHLGIPDGLLDPRGPRGLHLPEAAVKAPDAKGVIRLTGSVPFADWYRAFYQA